MKERNDRIVPFLWIKGEAQEVIAKEIKAIKNMGIDALCVESRTHPDFCGETWFEDMRFILKTAKENDMRVWLLDDAHYPTGFANGSIIKHPENRPWRIKAFAVDVAGEICGSRVYLPLEADETALGVYLVQKKKNGFGKIEDITKDYVNSYVKLTQKSGSYKVIMLLKTHDGDELPNYIDVCTRESVDRLIEAVYEPHYQHFKEEFGKTFVGFFSDEPRFSNTYQKRFKTPWQYAFGVGTEGMCYPWTDEVQEIFDEDRGKLLSLWWDIDETTVDVRCSYMNAITGLYAKNFCGYLAEWCHNHGVLYGGHIIEDDGAHFQTGCSAGHYFRSQEGSDFASIDVVLHQMKAFETDYITRAPIAGGFAYPDFYLFTLAKLASSCARIDARKKGRALCEIFGAYGNAESTKTMLFLVNHMLSRGINCFIPHAFSMEENDKDCPPYFNMGGKNPAIKGYKFLFNYMSRMSKLFGESRAKIKVALLYNAEGVWMDKNYTTIDKIGRILMENQIDYDLVPSYELDEATVNEKSLSVADVQYNVVLVPQTKHYPKTLRKTLEKIEHFTMFVTKCKVDIERVNSLAQKDFALAKKEKNLRVVSFQNSSKDFLFVFNEGYTTVKNTLCLENGVYKLLDPVLDESEYICGDKIDLQLSAGQVKIISREAGLSNCFVAVKELKSFDLYYQRYDENENHYFGEVVNGFDIHDCVGFENFSGELIYKTEYQAKQGERLVVKYNGEYCDVSYGDCRETTIGGIVKTKAFLENGLTSIEIRIGGSIGYSKKDKYSIFDKIEGTAIVSLMVEKQQ